MKSDKNKTVTIILAFFGIHRLYLGRIGTGLIQFILCIFLVGYIWVFIDLLHIFGNSFKDGKGKYLLPSSLEAPPWMETRRKHDEIIIRNEIDRDLYKNQIMTDILYLNAIIAYYGDGSISESELSELYNISEKCIPEDILDRRIAAMQLLADILDSLRNALEQVSSKEEKMEVVFYSTEFFSKKINTYFNENTDITDEDATKFKESIYNNCKSNLLSGDKRLTKDQKIILDTIEIQFNLRKKTLGLF